MNGDGIAECDTFLSLMETSLTCGFCLHTPLMKIMSIMREHQERDVRYSTG